MATRTQDRISAVQRALPVSPAPVGEVEEVEPALSPLFALLIAAVVMVGGAFAGASRWWVLVAATVGSTQWCPAAVARGPGLDAAMLRSAVLALGAVAAAVGTGRCSGCLAWPAVRRRPGCSGWCSSASSAGWKTLTTTDISAAWQVA